MEYSGGYFLLSAASADQASYQEQLESRGFRVRKLISMDEAVGGVFPNLFDIWANRLPERPTPILSETVLDKVLLSRVFGTLEDAWEGYREAKPKDASVSLIGISLDEKYLEEFYDWLDQTNDGIEEGDGVVNCLEKKQVVSSGGIFRGFDVAGYEGWGWFLSFLGNDLLQDYLAHEPTVSINEWGLFPNQQTAEVLACYTNDVLKDLVGAEENLIWLPWKITEYHSI
ncbi:hypothetical protein [Metaplanococcus flavidus]|uniref:Uncharacterized protein n=1 Tax=Metaplanococcus flavidus TaxID=569883 RepID=A0ABW3LAU4_9BACL